MKIFQNTHIFGHDILRFKSEVLRDLKKYDLFRVSWEFPFQFQFLEVCLSESEGSACVIRFFIRSVKWIVLVGL